MHLNTAHEHACLSGERENSSSQEPSAKHRFKMVCVISLAACRSGWSCATQIPGACVFVCVCVCERERERESA